MADETNIEVENPIECPFNSECQCQLYGMFEGEQANKCPLGSYGAYEFPPLCPLLDSNYTVKLVVKHEKLTG